jgi:hypothetical protein
VKRTLISALGRPALTRYCNYLGHAALLRELTACDAAALRPRRTGVHLRFCDDCVMALARGAVARVAWTTWRSRPFRAVTEAVAAAWRRPTSPTLPSSRGWWRRQAAWNSRMQHEPARFLLSGLGQARHFGTANNQPQPRQARKFLFF